MYVCKIITWSYTHNNYYRLLILAMEVKRVELDRRTSASNPSGTFGFSILGGAGTKFPALVCEIDAGGPADQCGKVNICILHIHVHEHMQFSNNMDLTPLIIIVSYKFMYIFKRVYSWNVKPELSKEIQYVTLHV